MMIRQFVFFFFVFTLFRIFTARRLGGKIGVYHLHAHLAGKMHFHKNKELEEI